MGIQKNYPLTSLLEMRGFTCRAELAATATRRVQDLQRGIARLPHVR